MPVLKREEQCVRSPKEVCQSHRLPYEVAIPAVKKVCKRIEGYVEPKRTPIGKNVKKITDPKYSCLVALSGFFRRYI